MRTEDAVTTDPAERHGVRPERRKTDRRGQSVTRAHVADMVAEEMDSQLSNSASSIILHFDAKMGQLHKSIADMIDKAVEKSIDKAIEAHVATAFPPGPLHKHKEHHQGLIDSAESMKKLRQDLLGWAVKGVFTVALLLIGMGALEWVKRELTK
jgi:hypothetical protein